MTFPAPTITDGDAARSRFITDIGKRVAQLDAACVPVGNFLIARAELQRVLGRFHYAIDEADYLQTRRELITLIAQCYRTAQACDLLTELAAVALTDAARQ